ncbi:MAG TPA: GAF domain-containing protein [Thermomicrobiales bacterium]|nr:GAF domain-containing protein [Thermomicrobiales bacterium]
MTDQNLSSSEPADDLDGEFDPTDARLGRSLRRLLTTVDSADALLPRETRSELLTLIVQTAARVTSANAASLFLINDEGTHLVFEVAIGPKADEAAKFLVPMGRGIVGVVAATGQPIAISAPENDPRFASEIAAGIGHIPQSILCVPLRYGDRIIGALEVLDKIGRDTFTASDIELLAYFAEISSLATEQTRRQDDLRTALCEILGNWANPEDDTEMEARITAAVDMVLAGTRSAPEYRGALQMAQLIGEISHAGDAERELCLAWLQSFQKYVQSRRQPFMSGLSWLQ